MKIVLQKFIADSGYCSRRAAQKLIELKIVEVNGTVASLGTRVDENDEVKIDGQIIKKNLKEKIYIILNKPNGFTCTNRKFKDEKNIFDLIDTKERLFAAGRLDKDSHGLVLLTNDGALVQELTHPKNEHEKEYLIKISDFKKPPLNLPLKRGELINPLFLGGGGGRYNFIEKFKKGIDIGEGDGIAKAKEIKYLGDNKFKIILTQGKKRQIRRMFKAVGCKVLDLQRVRIDKYKLGNLAKGKWIKINN